MPEGLPTASLRTTDRDVVHSDVNNPIAGALFAASSLALALASEAIGFAMFGPALGVGVDAEGGVAVDLGAGIAADVAAGLNFACGVVVSFARSGGAITSAIASGAIVSNPIVPHFRNPIVTSSVVPAIQERWSPAFWEH
ncbi:MAG: hypothetical protein WA871_10200 [Candidatus Acidiferrales bacterium]